MKNIYFYFLNHDWAIKKGSNIIKIYNKTKGIIREYTNNKLEITIKYIILILVSEYNKFFKRNLLFSKYSSNELSRWYKEIYPKNKHHLYWKEKKISIN